MTDIDISVDWILICIDGGGGVWDSLNEGIITRIIVIKRFTGPKKPKSATILQNLIDLCQNIIEKK